MTDYLTPDNIPFRILKPIHRTLQECTVIALNTIDPLPIRLGAEVMAGLQKSKALKNPSKGQLLGYICAWYELCELTHNQLPDGDMKVSIKALLDKLQWCADVMKWYHEQKAQETA